MHVKLKENNYELTQANRKYVIDKIKSLENLINSERINSLITVNKFQREIEVEVKVSVENTIIAKAESISGDFYVTIDIITEQLEKQIKRKTKAFEDN